MVGANIRHTRHRYQREVIAVKKTWSSAQQKWVTGMKGIDEFSPNAGSSSPEIRWNMRVVCDQSHIVEITCNNHRQVVGVDVFAYH